MNVRVGDTVLIQIGDNLVRARVEQYINNMDIIVNLLEHSMHGETVISVSLPHIVEVLVNPYNEKTTINTFISRNGGGRAKKSRNIRLKNKRSKRY